jgi:chromosome segregation ATPase
MPNKSQATRKATQQVKKIRQAVSDNLVDLEENLATRAGPNELNQKIGQIDTDLDGLRRQLNKTNMALMENLSQINDKDTNLRAKVTQAYQHLGELDSAYQFLSNQSVDISKEIKSVTKRINEVSQKSDERFDNLGEEYRAVVQRIEELAAKSKRTTQELNKSIKANAQAMKELEQKLIAEIDDLAHTSRERDNSLEQKSETLAKGLRKADEEIRASQARLIKMQAIDQALEKRAEALESTSHELTNKSRELSRSTTILNNRTQEMSRVIAELQETTQEHGTLITTLQEHAEKTTKALFTLILQEKRHFRLLSASLGLLLLAFLGYLLYNQAHWREETMANTALQSGIDNLTQGLAVTDNRLTMMDNRLGAFNQSSMASDKALKKEISTINQKLVTMGDQIDSLDGRLNNLRPHRTFGNGNVIHGPVWLTQQVASHYVIHLATLRDKQALYQLAERYSHYLKGDLAYLPVDINGSQRFALVYGSFESETQATSVLSRLPRYIERQRPRVHEMRRVQHYLADSS